ncbi:hypothetical protein BD408DRAFT_447166 [Parasitella parasitica]|nr:hypothetical protein BD408DRAFT_447166 [Parasitella parasitica]
MSKEILACFNRCYCCLSLRAGVFLNSFCSLTFPYLIELATANYVSSMNATNAELAGITDISLPVQDYPDRYFHIRIPYINGPINVFSIISASTYIIGMIGSYKKSPKLVKYHKYLLFFDILSTPLTLIECIWASSSEWSKISMPDNLDMPANLNNMITIIIVFIGATASSIYLQQIYAAYVTYKYERYLTVTKHEKKEKGP